MDIWGGEKERRWAMVSWRSVLFAAEDRLRVWIYQVVIALGARGRYHYSEIWKEEYEG